MGLRFQDKTLGPEILVLSLLASRAWCEAGGVKLGLQVKSRAFSCEGKSGVLREGQRANTGQVRAGLMPRQRKNPNKSSLDLGMNWLIFC